MKKRPKPHQHASNLRRHFGKQYQIYLCKVLSLSRMYCHGTIRKELYRMAKRMTSSSSLMTTYLIGTYDIVKEWIKRLSIVIQQVNLTKSVDTVGPRNEWVVTKHGRTKSKYIKNCREACEFYVHNNRYIKKDGAYHGPFHPSTVPIHANVHI